MVLTPKGLFLIEIKSWTGRVRGDASTWELIRDRQSKFVDNPLLLTNRKAKKLKSLLERQRAVKRTRVPWIEPLVFLSGSGVEVGLDYSLRGAVHVRDKLGREGKPDRLGIVSAISDVAPGSGTYQRHSRIDAGVARALTKAVDEAGNSADGEHLLLVCPRAQRAALGAERARYETVVARRLPLLRDCLVDAARMLSQEARYECPQEHGMGDRGAGDKDEVGNHRL